jgi:hypothetical protein
VPLEGKQTHFLKVFACSFCPEGKNMQHTDCISPISCLLCQTWQSSHSSAQLWNMKTCSHPHQFRCWMLWTFSGRCYQRHFLVTISSYICIKQPLLQKMRYSQQWNNVHLFLKSETIYTSIEEECFLCYTENTFNILKIK